MRGAAGANSLALLPFRATSSRPRSPPHEAVSAAAVQHLFVITFDFVFVPILIRSWFHVLCDITQGGQYYNNPCSSFQCCVRKNVNSFPLEKTIYRSCCAGLLQHSALDHTHTPPRFQCLLCCSSSLQDHEVHVVGNSRVPRVEQAGLAARKRKFDFKICVGEDEEFALGGDHAERLDVLGVVNTRDLRECPRAPGK